MKRRVVITGMGAVTPLGPSLRDLWDGVCSGRSGVGPITRFDASGLSTRIAAEVKGFDPLTFMDRKQARRTDLFTQYALAAADMAIQDAGLTGAADPDRFGVVLGTGIGGINSLAEQFEVGFTKGPERVSPHFVPMMIANIAAAQLAMKYGAKGPNFTTLTACAASATALGEAFRLIQRGEADVVLTGGTEAPLVPVALAGFCAMKALSERNDEPEAASRPFDRDRDGFVMGEGAALVVLESLEHATQRGARPVAEMLGYGCTADAYHVTAPCPDGEGAARCMERALLDAGLSPEQVGYINTHGTATPTGDVAEARAIKTVFGSNTSVPVSSTKSMTGHLMGAAGAAEACICALALTEGVLPPTINLDNPDPDCDLDLVPNTRRIQPIEAALSNSFGFGGQNTTLILGKI